MSAAHFPVGSRVTWTHAMRGGLHYSPTPGVVRKLGAKRIQIEVRHQEPYSRSRVWHPTLKWVDPAALADRAFPSEVFDEPMVIETSGFTVTGWRHPFGPTRHFPRGTWYGQVDGYQCTAPCFSEEAAVESAHHALMNGGYRVALQTAIEVRLHWIATNQDADGIVAAALPDLHARLNNVAASNVDLRGPLDSRWMATHARAA